MASKARKKTSKRLAVGVDRGGTRTRIVLLNARGAELKRVVHPTSHLKHLPDLIVKTAAAWRLEPHVPVVIATRGAMTRKWKKPFLLKKLKGRVNLLDVISDAQAAYLAAHGSGPGVLLIAGTGSVVFLKRRNGRFGKIGGHSPAGGDPGSGLWIGTRFLKRTKAGPALWPGPARKKCGAGGKRLSRRDRAACAAEALRRAEKGDKIAAELIREAQGHLSDLLAAAIALCAGTVSKAAAPLRVALTGGLMQNAFFRKNFIALARRRLLTARHGSVLGGCGVRLAFITLRRPAEHAAAKLALGSFYERNKKGP